MRRKPTKRSALFRTAPLPAVPFRVPVRQYFEVHDCVTYSLRRSREKLQVQAVVAEKYFGLAKDTQRFCRLQDRVFKADSRRVLVQLWKEMLKAFPTEMGRDRVFRNCLRANIAARAKELGLPVKGGWNE